MVSLEQVLMFKHYDHDHVDRWRKYLVGGKREYGKVAQSG